MNEVSKAIGRQLIVALILTALFVAGIPAVVLGAVKRLWVVMGIGIFFAVVGFYGMPIAWVNYGSKSGLKRVVYAVTAENLLSVREIAAQLGKSEKNVRELLDDCFRLGYLGGYKRSGDEIVPNEEYDPERERKPKTFATECPYCGAKFVRKVGEPAACPYCGAASGKE